MQICCCLRLCDGTRCVPTTRIVVEEDRDIVLLSEFLSLSDTLVEASRLSLINKSGANP